MKRWINRGLGLFVAAVLAIAPAIPQAAQQSINRGTTAGDGQGETLFSAFGKVNANDLELYGAKTEFVANAAALPATGEVGKIYVTTDDDTMHRWTGTGYDDLGAIQFVANAAALPVTGAALNVYVANDTGVAWRWNGTGYQALGWNAASTAPVYPATGNDILLVEPAANTLAVVGDSITSLYNDVTATGYLTNNAGYLTWALALSGQRMTVVSENSVGGNGFIYSGIPPGIPAQVTAAIASGAKHLLMMGGQNDFLLGGYSVDQVVAAAAVEIDRAVAAGMTVWLGTIPPVNSTYGSYTTAFQSQIIQFNSRARSLVASRYARSSVHLVDLYAAVVDPNSATGSGKTNWSFDNQHPRNLGARPMGAELARVWKLWVPEAPQLLASKADQYGYHTNSLNLIDNGLFIDGAAPGTGFAVSGTGGATSVNTLVARADGFGNDLRMEITFPAAGTYEVRINNYKTRIVDGDEFYAQCEVTVESPINVTEPTLTLDAYTTGGTQGTQATRTSFTKYANSLPIESGYTAHLKTPPLLYTVAGLGGINSSSVYVSIAASAAGSVTLKVGRMSVPKLKLFE